MQSINPATNTLIKEYQEFSETKIPAAIEQVHHAWLEWKKVSYAQRAILMHKASEVLLQKREKYARLITDEMGKTIVESRGEVEKCAMACRYYADNTESILSDERIPTEAKKSLVTFEPLGIVLAVMPWNFPFWQVFRFAAPALMAGNAAILKHASNVPGAALAIEEVFREAGFPEHLFQTLLISSRFVPQIIADPRVKASTLTGSEAAGSKVAELSGKALKTTVLELGGSDAFIVLEDADMEACVKTAVLARLFNVGQSCIASKRFLVMDSVADQFESELTKAVEQLVIGDPADEKTQIGPMAREDLLEELDEQVQKSIQMGAKLLLGGKKVDRPGSFYAPTILTNITPEMTVFREETFGPVFAIVRVKSDVEAIALANDSEFGLGGSVWTKNLEQGEKVARQIETGAVFVNAMTKSDPRLPFGGIKKSGYGRELSHYGIKEFVNIKTIWIQ